MSHHALTLIVLYLNSMVDSGKYDGVTLDEVTERVADGSILRWLRDTGDIDLSGHFAGTYGGDFEAWYVGSLQSLNDAYGDGSKWAVRNRGICLLLAWTNELLQQGVNWRRSDALFHK